MKLDVAPSSAAKVSPEVAPKGPAADGLYHHVVDGRDFALNAREEQRMLRKVEQLARKGGGDQVIALVEAAKAGHNIEALLQSPEIPIELKELIMSQLRKGGE